jgi:undecaprenyl-diphosphatase
MLFGFTFFLVYVLAGRSRLRTVGLVLLAAPIALVGPSRLYLGQHWLSDVLGGYAVAAMLLLLMSWTYTKWRLNLTQGRVINRPTSREGMIVSRSQHRNAA